MYTLIGNPKNRSFRVLWALEELGVPYEIEPEQPQSAGMRAANPSGKAPALRVDDEILIDSVAIVQFLADRHGDLSHAPGSVARAKQDSLLHFALDDFDGSAWTLAKHSFVFPEALRQKDAIRDGVSWDLTRAYAAFQARVGDGPWLSGERFTVADIITVHCAQWLSRASQVPQCEALTQLVERAVARPAYQRADAIRQAA